MKKNIGKRILSLALALVMVAGWMPHMATEAHAAEPITLSDNTFSDPGNGFYFQISALCGAGDCDVSVTFNSQSGTTTKSNENHSFTVTSFSYNISAGKATWSYSCSYETCQGSGTFTFTNSDKTFTCTNDLYLGSSNRTSDKLMYVGVYLCRPRSAHQGDATCQTAANCTLCGTSYTNANNHEKPNEFTYSVNTSDNTKHDVKYACCGATKETVAHTAEPTYTVNATDHTKHDKTYSCCEGIAETTGHSYTYTADDFVLTETCTNNCGHQAIASIVAGEALYTGSEITDAATISYDSGTWAGDAPVLSFENNVTVGTATAKMTAGDATASTTFKINPASLSYATVTLDPASGTYTGSVHNRPAYTLTYNGKQLVENTDYIVDANWSGDFTNVGSCNLILKGNGNFTGYKTLTYTIGKGTPTKEMFTVQWPQEPVYDGGRKEVTVTSNKEGMGQITVIYFQGNDLEHTLDPIDAHGYNVAIKVAEGENYNGATIILGSFSISPATGQIEIPAGQTVIYDGEAIIAGTSGADILYCYNGDSTPRVKWYADMGGTKGGEISAPTDAGTYWIGVSAGEGNYTEVEEVNQTFTITKADPICTAPTAIAGLVYNGKEKTLIYSAESLDGTVYYSLDGSNYTESLPMAVNAQEYTVYYKVVGDANHNDMEPKTVTATIAPFNIGTASIKGGVLGDSFTYNGQEHTPDVQIDVSIPSGEANEPLTEVKLTKDTDYTVAYANNVNAGQAVVTITGKGNYTGTITREFTIAPKELDGSAVSIPDMSLPYTGEAQTVAIVVPEGVTYELVEGTMTATNAGMYGFTIRFTGNHTGISTQGWQITAVAPNATAPTANTLTYNGEDQTLIAAGATNDGTMVYSLEKEGTYTAELPRAKTAGTYHVWYKVIGDGNHTDSDPASVEVRIDKADPGIGAVTAAVVNDTLETSAIVLTRADTTVPGTLTVDAEQTLAWGDNTVRYTFTPNDTTNYTTVTGTVTVTVADTVAPTGTVAISTNSWTEFLNSITFGLFFKETQTVSVTASDNLSGVAKIEYIESGTALDLDAVKAATQWTEMKNGSVSVTLEDTKQFVYYIRITDKAGNIAYLSSDGAEYDTAAPVIAGVDNGVTYYTTQNVTVTDKNIDTVTLNGEAATGSVSLAGNKEATYTIVATDKAGNSATVTVTMKPIKALAEATDGITQDNVTSADAPALEALVEKLDELLADEDVSDDGEKETLEQHKAAAESLLQTVEDTAAEQKAAADKAAQYDGDAVKSADKAELEKLAEDIEALLDTDNLTQDERADLDALLEDVGDMIDTINTTAADSKTAADAIDARDPETVKSTDKAAIEKALETVEDLLDGDHLTGDERKALEDTKADAEALLAAIEAASKAADTENTAKVEDVTAGNATPEDKSDLEKAKADLEDALENNVGNYTEEEKKAIEDEIARIDGALQVVGNVEAFEAAISGLPAAVEPDDEETVAKIEDAKKIYNELTDYEKSLVDEKVKEKLDKLTAAAVAYDIIKGDGGKWSEGTASGLSFTANGPISKFVSVEIDGKVIDAKHYSVKSGSTVITLNASYLDTLSVGTHTVTVVYSDGETEGTFEISPKSAPPATPATGDGFNLLLWTAILFASVAALAVLLINRKRFAMYSK